MFKNHLKIAWRSLQKRKVFSLINILGLALGFSCAILIFLFVSYHLQFDNFHEHQDRVYRIVTEEIRDETEYESAVPPGFANAFRSEYDFAEKVAKIYFRSNWQVDRTSGIEKKRFKEDIAFVESDFFEILNFPLLERLGDQDLTQPNTAFITERFSKKMFKNESALGKTFTLESLETVQIIGILKDIPDHTIIDGDVFISFKTLKSYDDFVSGESWGGINSSLSCFALLHENQNIAQIEETLIELVTKHRPKSKNVHRYKLLPIKSVHLNKYYGGIGIDLLWIFSLVGLFIILIACINFINISTAQAFTRSKEIGIKKVLGTFKQHLFWQFITETFLLSFFALLIGLSVVILILPSFNQLFGIHLTLQSLLTFKVLCFVVFLLLFVSFFAGSYPGIILARILPVLALKGKLSQRDTGGNSTRKILVTIQFTISIILIVVTVVIGKQIDFALQEDLGFDKEAIVMVQIPEEIEEIKLEGLKERLSQIPGIKSSTACLSSPGGAANRWGTSVRYDNRPETEEFSISAKIADKEYINTFGMKLLYGRNFKRLKDTIHEVVVNERLAQKLGLNSPQELIGKELEVNGGRMKASIVGVLANFHDQDFHATISPVFIAPYTDAYSEIAIKIDSKNTKQVLADIRKKWEETFPKFIYEYKFLSDRVADQYAQEQQFLTLSKLFSGLAIFISCLGLYGMISFFIARRKKEIGIRKVLGGKISDIVVLFTRDFFKLILIAGFIATPIAWYFVHIWLQGYAYKTTIDWWIFVLAIFVIVIITLTTIGYQTIKAAIDNPVESLKTE